MNKRVLTVALALTGAVTAPISAQEINTNALSENGWFSDDTRADGSGTEVAGTNLVSDTLTDDPEATASGTPAHDADIEGQIAFVPAPGTVPAGTHDGSVHLFIDATTAGKSQISHRKDDGVGHGPGSGFGPGFSAEYSWMGDGPASITASLKFGIKTAEFGATGVSSRTGENAWDKVLIYEPGNGNGATSDGLWQTETIDHTTGKWWFFDRTAGASIIGAPMTLADMALSPVLVGGGPKTVADVYALITAPGAHITSVQFGIGSFNADGSIYVNQLETSVYRSGMTTTFGKPSPFDQDVTPDAIFGGGNANGFYTVARENGIELGLRSKLRFPPTNQFNSNGDGTYTWSTGVGSAFPAPIWSFEWSANTDFDGSSGLHIDDLTYELGIDFDASADTDFLAFDPITPGTSIPYTPATPPIDFFDHSIGDNSTPNGGGTEAADAPTYAALIAANNVIQNSWRMDFFDEFPFDVFDPTVPGRYEFYLAAFDSGEEVARTEITVLVMDGATLTLEAGLCQDDQDPITPGVQVEYELWLRNPDDTDVTGYQAFLEFDDVALTYVGAQSSYAAGIFGTHIQGVSTAEVAPGELQLDGNALFSTGTDGDALLATLVFTVASECTPVSVAFDTTQPFDSEVSFEGSPLATDLLDSPSVVPDDTAPILAGVPTGITQPADAGSCTEAIVSWTMPTATDNCDPSPVVVCDPPSGSVFPVGATTVTCAATDECGNVAESSFVVTVTATNAIDVVIELTGSLPATRCIHFVTDSCSTVADVPLVFTGSAPAVAVATIEVPCGVWTVLSAKDEQHTKWGSTTLTIVGANYVADTTLVLDGGDTDNDGDVDINDVTLFLAQFGDLASSGGCAWDGTRDADFDNSTAVGSSDYASLVSGWLTTSSPACFLASGAPNLVRPDLQRWIPVEDQYAAAADRNGDGRVDVRDVELFEREHGLSGALSRRMRSARD